MSAEESRALSALQCQLLRLIADMVPNGRARIVIDRRAGKIEFEQESQLIEIEPETPDAQPA